MAFNNCDQNLISSLVTLFPSYLQCCLLNNASGCNMLYCLLLNWPRRQLKMKIFRLEFITDLRACIFCSAMFRMCSFSQKCAPSLKNCSVQFIKASLLYVQILLKDEEFELKITTDDFHSKCFALPSIKCMCSFLDVLIPI